MRLRSLKPCLVEVPCLAKVRTFLWNWVVMIGLECMTDRRKNDGSREITREIRGLEEVAEVLLHAIRLDAIREEALWQITCEITRRK